jgi:stalled ribosome rescue protein Dom34
MSAYFSDITKAVSECHEILLTGPGLARQQFTDWYTVHAAQLSKIVVNSIASDHPSDAQLIAMARQYFKKFDAMAADPTQI